MWQHRYAPLLPFFFAAQLYQSCYSATALTQATFPLSSPSLSRVPGAFRHSRLRKPWTEFRHRHWTSNLSLQKTRTIHELRGGAHTSSASATATASNDNDNDKAGPRRLQNFRQFASKNFFLLGMFVTVGLARLAPALGKSGGTLRADLLVGKFGVSCIFLLSGLSLELSDLRQAASNHKLNTSVLFSTFGLWPFLVGLPLTSLLSNVFPNLLTPPLRDGLLILTCLPTTINMCVILTTAAGGSVATALWNAVISNLAGIFVTPMLLLQFFGKYIQVPFLEMLMKLCSKVLLPVAVGQALRQVGGKTLYDDNKKFFKRLQEVSAC
jgi:sodium/bile acid cotransporter 7